MFLWIGYNVEWPVGSLKMVHEHQVYCVSTAGKGMTLPSLKEKHPWSKITVMLWGSGEISIPRRDVGTGRPALGRGASEGPAGWWVTLRQIWEYRYGCRGWRIVNHAVLNLKSCRKRLPLTSLTNIKWQWMNHFYFCSHVFRTQVFGIIVAMLCTKQRWRLGNVQGEHKGVFLRQEEQGQWQYAGNNGL